MLSIIHVKENKYFYQRCSFCETCFIDEALLPMNYVYKSIPDVSRLFLIKKNYQFDSDLYSKKKAVLITCLYQWQYVCLPLLLHIFRPEGSGFTHEP